MIVKLISFLILSLSLLLAPGTAKAEHLVFVTDPFPPYYYPEDDQIKGLQYELANLAFKKMRLSFTIKFVPWKRALMLAESAKADGVFGLRKTEEREKWLIYPDEPLMRVHTVIFHRMDDNFEFEGLQSLTGKRVGIIKGYTYGEEFDESKHFKKEEVTTLKQNFLKLMAGRLDLVAAYQAVGVNTLKELGLENKIGYSKQSVHITPMYIGFAKNPGFGRIAREFSHTLRQVKNSPECEALMLKLNLPKVEESPCR